MTTRAILHALACAAGLAAASIQAACASETIYDSAGFLTGQQSFEQSFTVSGPGQLTVTLSNYTWPTSLSSLNLVIGNASGLLGPEMGAGSEDFQLTGGKIFAQWFGTAQGPLDTGVYGVKIDWTPAVVPLPTSIGLLLSGLALLAWQRRYHRAAENAGPTTA